jgi:hypothetical protein
MALKPFNGNGRCWRYTLLLAKAWLLFKLPNMSTRALKQYAKKDFSLQLYQDPSLLLLAPFASTSPPQPSILSLNCLFFHKYGAHQPTTTASDTLDIIYSFNQYTTIVRFGLERPPRTAPTAV